MFRGYIEAIRELEQQLDSGNGKIKFDDIVVACGRFFFFFWSMGSLGPFSLFSFFLLTRSWASC